MMALLYSSQTGPEQEEAHADDKKRDLRFGLKREIIFPQQLFLLPLEVKEAANQVERRGFMTNL